MVVCIPAIHLPGRAIFTALTVLALSLAGLVVVARERALWPRPADVAAGVPVALLVAMPFLSAGYAGTLGLGINNDMASHLLVAETWRFAEIAAVNGLNASYPIGPHALVASVSEGLDFDVDFVFAGLTAAVPVLLGLTALSVFGRAARWPAKALVVTLVGLPFLVAGYYGQGSFKELMQALLVMGVALELRRFDPESGRLRWVPLAVIFAGILAVYSIQGLAWPVAIGGVWLGVLVALALARPRPVLGPVWSAVRREIVPVAIAVGVLLVAIVPQLPRLSRFASDTLAAGGTGISRTGAGALGNLVGPLPVWEAFGIWDNGDYRLGAIDPYATGVLAGMVLLLVFVGAWWWIRRGDWVVPAACFACWVLWVYANHSQAPYLAAKALMVWSPFVILVAVRPLVARRWGPNTPRWWVPAATVVVAIVAVLAGSSTWRAVRSAHVGPRDHLEQLRALRPLLEGKKTLFLGNDDFLAWELSGIYAQAPLVAFQVLPIRPEKAWDYGRAHDIDSLDAATINTYDWIITPRDPAGSKLPPQLELVRETPNFALYRRTGPVQERRLLAEGEGPAALLDCKTPEGRAIARQKGTAEVRRGPVGVEVKPIVPGETSVVRLKLAPGTWSLATPYQSAQPLEVTTDDSRVVLPPNLDRPGPRYFAGRIKVVRPGTVTVRIKPQANFLTPKSRLSYPVSLIAVPDFGARTVPLAQACGELVDSYTVR